MTQNTPQTKADTPSLSNTKLRAFLEGNTFTWAITSLILINAVTLGLETNSSLTPPQTELLYWVDKAILIAFSLELTLKFFAFRLNFFKSGWNIFDLLIVTIAWVPASGAFAVLRALRILRVLRLISVVPQMRRVIGAIVASVPGMLSVVGVLSIVFYVAAVLTTKLFGQHPDPNMQEWFGTISSSAYTLFQIMTLESWSMGIVRPTMEIFPHSWIFFIPFIIITSFAVLNLFIGIIVDAMQTSHDETDEKITEMANITHEDLLTLINRFESLESKIDRLSDSEEQSSRKD
ncbi:ion transporter [uncultured Kiloniella sp.]|uniref:ion transporter n=1 Tax=uncultured Kiloniella sp. TaxID=1133091 RepID=UPI0026186A55|nr:ion transporter [uncultured Kiloniella sp.]